MTTAEVQRKLDETLAGLQPTLPIELSDISTVRAMVIAALPGYGVETFHNTHEIRVGVYLPRGILVASKVLKP